MKIRLDRKKKFQLLLAVSVMLTGLIVGSLFMILGGDIDRIREQERGLAQEIVLVRELLDERKSSRDAVLLLGKKDPALVMNALTGLASDSDVRLVSLKSSGTADEKQWPYRRVLFDARVYGTFRCVGLFLAAVRDMPEGIMDIQALSMTMDSADPSMVTARVTFALFEDKGHGQK